MKAAVWLKPLSRADLKPSLLINICPIYMILDLTPDVSLRSII